MGVEPTSERLPKCLSTCLVTFFFELCHTNGVTESMARVEFLPRHARQPRSVPAVQVALRHFVLPYPNEKCENLDRVFLPLNPGIKQQELLVRLHFRVSCHFNVVSGRHAKHFFPHSSRPFRPHEYLVGITRYLYYTLFYVVLQVYPAKEQGFF